ncbi:hypothetical protein TRAPUB_11399 [Trametes pubescens]|uniref:Uncharacterized protein n=1 Tax=Trametes pubescens TaxID=154538 RepID=A0A1M2VWT8_TRAPU|nr:hypothetical protein TRAPUB_11399 [Trametes pubescens]
MGTSLGGMSSLLITPGYEPPSFRRLSQIAPANFPGHDPEEVRVDRDPSVSSAEV